MNGEERKREDIDEIIGISALPPSNWKVAGEETGNSGEECDRRRVSPWHVEV